MNQLPDRLPPVDDPRLFHAVQEYLQELEAGRRPDRRALAARFPDLSGEMAEYLDALDMVHAAAPLLHQQPANLRPQAGEEHLPAEPLGDFRIVRELGRGGMGVVYEAVQLSLGRRVALKTLPFAAALDARQLQRFKNEAQAAAHLHHTSIVPVYAVGKERGVHFYAMQLIEGQNLATLIEELRRREAPGQPSPDQSGPAAEPTGPFRTIPQAGTTVANAGPSLGTQFSTWRSQWTSEYFRAVARLMAKAAEALDYAHGMGVIHRDVKPANLLINDRGNVWITDFGLAQFQTDAGLTQSGDLVGTLRYMSPEQAGGQRILIDHRTDVYSLGATLYELLTLRPIFDSTDRNALLYQIVHEEPRPPRAIDRSIPAELETIVLKAIGKTPAERYDTAQELADDLHRYLEDRPIRARRPSLVEKATKWARRHRAVVVSAVWVLVLSFAGLAVATVLIARAYERERQKAQEAQEQRVLAEESFRQARQAVEQFAQIEQEWVGSPPLEGARRRLLEAALTYYQDFIDQHRDDPKIQAELEESRDKVKRIIGELTTLMGAAQYTLLLARPVQDALSLSEEQRKAVISVDKIWHESFPKIAEAGPAERERLRLQVAQEQEAEVVRILKPDQLRRFKQIILQQRGPFAFTDPDVVETLRLTAEQKKRIAEILTSAGLSASASGPPPGGRRGPPPEWFGEEPKDGGRRGPPKDWFGEEPKGGPRRGPRQDWFDEPKGGPRRGPPPEWFGADKQSVVEEIQKVLTEEQKRVWDAIIGDPFTERVFPPGPHGPGGPWR